MNSNKLCAAVTVILAMTSAVVAHDLVPPTWRGECNTTFQEWRFDDADDPAAPEVIANPFGPALVDITVGQFGSGWLYQLGGLGAQTGFWDLGGTGGSMLVWVKDRPGPVSQRSVWVQVTYWTDISQPPSVSVLGATQESSQTLLVESVPTGGSWMLYQGVWTLAPAPDEDDIVITADWQWGSVVDQIVVDTRSIPGAPECGDLFADTDGDGDVDQADFATFQLCVTGPDECVPVGCECFDRPVEGSTSGDGDVDVDDLDAFEACSSGPGIPADTGCDDNP